ncbi:hypothetical protein ACFQ4C_30085 [Larkinella insperata]|uniref:DUF4268 domain-containing protein n=1 Tax=Larkinella insperata TaxID=332158 RepID=A0ABW3QFN9_9BACT
MNRTWLEPWDEIAQEEKQTFKKQLAKEITSKHPLYELELELIGRSYANDDILVEVEKNRLAVVHLTWSNNPGDQYFPRTTFYPNWAAFFTQKMTEDNRGY